MSRISRVSPRKAETQGDPFTYCLSITSQAAQAYAHKRHSHRNAIGGISTEILQRHCGKERIYVEKAKNYISRARENKEHTLTWDIPVWKRYTLTITEAAEYYHIGEAKLRYLVDSHRNADFANQNGNRVLIKRQKFESFLEEATVL